MERYIVYNEIHIVWWGGWGISDNSKWIRIVQWEQHYGIEIYQRNVLIHSLYTDVYDKHYSA